MNAVVYARQSKDVPEGIDRQVADCLREAERRGWDVLDVYRDNDLAATRGKPDRPGFKAVLADMQSGRAKVVIALEFTRLTRNGEDKLALLNAARDNGVFIRILKHGDVDCSTAMGRAQAEFGMVIAALESEQMVERMVRANEDRAARGLVRKGRRPFGFEYSAVDGTSATLVPHPVEGPVVAEMYERYVACESLSGIARWLNESGIATSSGKAWTKTSVRALLARASSAGHLVYKGAIVKQGAFPALVDNELWLRAQMMLTDPSKTAPGKVKRKHLLPGIAECGLCGSLMETSYTGAPGHSVRTYKCPARHLARRADWIDEHVTRAVMARMSAGDAFHLLNTNGEARVAALRNELAEVGARMTELSQMWVDKTLSGDQFRDMNKPLVADKARLEDALAAATTGSVLAGLVADDAAEVRARWDGYTVEQQRDTVRRLFRVVVNPPTRNSGGRGAVKPGVVWSDNESIDLIPLA